MTKLLNSNSYDLNYQIFYLVYSDKQKQLHLNFFKILKSYVYKL